MPKISIKEAGRYSNYLNNQIRELVHYTENLGIPSKLFEVTEEHKRVDAHKESKDETIDREFEDLYDIELKDMTMLVEAFIAEKVTLGEAIAKAKKRIKIPDGSRTLGLDPAIEYAKLIREHYTRYNEMLLNNKEGKRTDKGRGYAINAEGNQTPFVYDIEINTKIKYDKAIIGKRDKEMKKKADELSTAIEKVMSDNLIDFTPKFSYLDTIEEAAKKL